MPMQIQRPARGPNQGNICPRCNTIMLLIEKPKGTSVGGVFGAFLFAFGLIRLLGNPLIGILLMILGLFYWFQSFLGARNLFCYARHANTKKRFSLSPHTLSLGSALDN